MDTKRAARGSLGGASSFLPGRKRRGVQEDGYEFLEFQPLGAGQEVGRSCHILRFKGVTIMLDCGVNPGGSGQHALPFFEVVNPEEIDLLLVSHFHLDHAAALPYYLKQPEFKGRVFMTHPTKSIYKMICTDYIKRSTLSVDNMLYTEKDIISSMNRIEGIDFHQTIVHKGIKFWCYNAGHVLGACMFMIQIANVKVLYTGDYSRSEDRHLIPAEVPKIKPDVLIIEATFGDQSLGAAKTREERFLRLVREIVQRGGKCLVPMFSQGRVQELLLILDAYWAANPDLHRVPVYYASKMAQAALQVFQTFSNTMNDKIKQARARGERPFSFKHIQNLQGIDFLNDAGPCVVLASPGMLQGGLSRMLFERWCGDAKNGVIIAGYTVQGTLAHMILNEPDRVPAANGGELELKMPVHHVSFAAHADYSETADFIRTLDPADVILVHGEKRKMGNLKDKLDQEKEAKQQASRLRVSTPANCQKVSIEIVGRKLAKMVGAPAETEPGEIVSGLVVEKDFRYTIMGPGELNQRTPLTSTTVRQKLKVLFEYSDELMKFFLTQMFDVKDNAEAKTKVDGDGNGVDDDAMDEDGDETDKKGTPIDVSVHGVVRVTRDEDKPRIAVLEWDSSPTNDMIADSIVSLLMSAAASPGAALQFQTKCCSLEPLASIASVDVESVTGAKPASETETETAAETEMETAAETETVKTDTPESRKSVQVNKALQETMAMCVKALGLDEEAASLAARIGNSAIEQGLAGRRNPLTVSSGAALLASTMSGKEVDEAAFCKAVGTTVSTVRKFKKILEEKKENLVENDSEKDQNGDGAQPASPAPFVVDSGVLRRANTGEKGDRALPPPSFNTIVDFLKLQFGSASAEVDGVWKATVNGQPVTVDVATRQVTCADQGIALRVARVVEQAAMALGRVTL